MRQQFARGSGGWATCGGKLFETELQYVAQRVEPQEIKQTGPQPPSAAGVEVIRISVGLSVDILGNDAHFLDT